MTEEQIKELVELVESLTPISDIAILMGFPESTIRIELSNSESVVASAYRLAKAKARLSIRKREIELAEAGSPVASMHVNEFIRQMDNDE